MLATVVLTPFISDLYLTPARSSSATAASLVACDAFTGVSHCSTSSSRTALLLRELIEDFLLIFLVSEFDLGSICILGGHLDVQFQDVDVLFGRGELRFDLLDFVL